MLKVQEVGNEAVCAQLQRGEVTKIVPVVRRSERVCILESLAATLCS